MFCFIYFSLKLNCTTAVVTSPDIQQHKIYVDTELKAPTRPPPSMHDLPSSTTVI